VRTTRLLLASLFLCVLAAAPPRAAADERLPGEAAELNDEVRAKVKGHLDALFAAKDLEAAVKARRAILTIGPVAWPVVENASRLLPPPAAKPHLNYLKALLVKKEEPEWEWLRGRLRRVSLVGNLDSVKGEILQFRLGRPDPAKPGQKIPPTCRPTKTGTTEVWRSGDGTIVLAFGGDATASNADAPDLRLDEPTAGFVAAVGGTPRPLPRHSGKGGLVSVKAPMGFVWAWAANGADGMKPAGEGGEGGELAVEAGAGSHEHKATGGAGAPG
jgi:hypothetical protein